MPKGKRSKPRGLSYSERVMHDLEAREAAHPPSMTERLKRRFAEYAKSPGGEAFRSAGGVLSGKTAYDTVQKIKGMTKK